jgi:pantothenate kinase-related protein Tda10
VRATKDKNFQTTLKKLRKYIQREVILADRDGFSFNNRSTMVMVSNSLKTLDCYIMKFVAVEEEKEVSRKTPQTLIMTGEPGAGKSFLTGLLTSYLLSLEEVMEGAPKDPSSVYLMCQHQIIKMGSKKQE